MMTKEDVESLLQWFDDSKRDLPWRHTADPYEIWVSEIMLQQTRVEAVKPYYSNFLNKYPNVDALAKAEDDDLVRIWEGLGYYSRVRNMHKAAVDVMILHGGLFPVSYEVLKTLPGIGDYTAGAVSSIAGGENVPAVDGNVLRVYTRFTADLEEITDAKCVKRIRGELAGIMRERMREEDTTAQKDNNKRSEKKSGLEVCLEDNTKETPEGVYTPGKFNSAMMELGAVICLPNGEPKCEECPLKANCRAFAEGTMTEYPKKAPKKARRIEERTIFIIESTGGIALRKRADKGLLAGMYEFPGCDGHLEKKEAEKYLKSLGYHPLRIKRVEDAKHIFSHVEWHMRAFYTLIDDFVDPVKEDKRQGIFFVTKEERMEGYALPSAFAAYKKYIQ